MFSGTIFIHVVITTCSLSAQSSHGRTVRLPSITVQVPTQRAGHCNPGAEIMKYDMRK